MAAVLSGCAGVEGKADLTSVSTPSGTSLRGIVHGGQQPISGAHVYLLAAGTSGYGGVSTSLLTDTGQSDSIGSYVLTASDGTFTSLASYYTCTPGTQVYLYALGGNPGNGTNSRSSLMAILGACPASGSFATTVPYIAANEVSTIAAAYAMAGFAVDATHVSTSNTTLAQTGIANAFANASNLETLSTGVANTTTPAGNGTVPQAEINTLANVLAFCVNSSDAQSTPCTMLFGYATNGSATPTDSATAAINIARNPGVNTTQLYGLSPGYAPFNPALTKAPTDFLIGLNFTGNGLDQIGNIAVDSFGNAWVPNSLDNSISKFSALGAPLSGSTGITSGGLSSPSQVAIDMDNNVWVANTGTTGLSEFTNAGAAVSGSPFPGGGLNGPDGLGVDGNNNIWAANVGNSTVSKFSNSGTPISSSAGFSGGGLNAPRGIAIDASNRAWVVNSATGYGLALLGTNGSPVTTSPGYVTGGIANGRAIAIDNNGQVWSVDQTADQITAITSAGAATPSSPYSGGGLSNPSGIAIDGAGNVWVANAIYTAQSLSEFTNAGVALSPSTGFTGAGLAGLYDPHGIAIDGSGDIWVSNYGSTPSVTEFIGAATPKVPNLSIAVATQSLGVRPDSPTSQSGLTLTWAHPAPITYGTALSATQLSASASIPGTFAYSPASGTVPPAGTQTLLVTFTPTDQTHYTTAQASVSLTVNKAFPVITWGSLNSVPAGSKISSAQLTATATFNGVTVPGNFAYTPSSGTTEAIPGNLTMQTIFTPNDTTDYQMVSTTNTLSLTTVGPPTYPAYSWTNVVIEDGGYVDGVYFHPLQQNLEYAKTDVGGPYRWDQPSGSSTGMWTPLVDWVSRANGNYFSTDLIGSDTLALDPTNANYLYLGVGIGLGSATGNLLISSDQGHTFVNVPLSWQISSNANGRSGGERLVVDPNMPNRLYFGTKLNGLMYSDNRGLTWSSVARFPALNTTNSQGVIFVLPIPWTGTPGTLTPVIVAGVAETAVSSTYSSLYISTDAGATWTPVTDTLTGSLLPWRGRLGPAHELYVTYNNNIGPSGVTAGKIVSYAISSTGVVSAPTDITPTNATTSPALVTGATYGFGDVEADPSNAGWLVASTIDASNNSDLIFRSTSDGASWFNMTNDTHDASAAPYILFHENPAKNENSNWINLAIDPFNSNHMIYGTGQMIWDTANLNAANTSGPVAFVEQANGQEELVVQTMIAPPSGTSLLVIGTDDVGGLAFPSLTQSPPNGAFTPNLGMTTGLDFSEANPSYVVRVSGNNQLTAVSGPYGDYSTNAVGNAWTGFGATAGSKAGGGSIAVSADGTTLVWAPSDASTVYSTNNGSTWTTSVGAPAQQAVVSDRVNASKFYTSNGSLYESTDKGHTFAAVAGTSSLSANTVYTSFAYEGDVWMASPTNGLYRNTGTASNMAITQVTGFTKAYNIAFGAPQPGSGYNDTIYVYGAYSGVDGIYRSTNNGTTWQIINDQQHQYGELNCIAADRRTFGTVYLGTAGRGVIVGTSTY